MQSPKLSLNVVGAGARGAIAAGMLKAVHELGIKPDMVYGCSSGALNAALFVQGDIDLLEHLWMNITNKDVRTLNLFGLMDGTHGLYSYSPLLKTLQRYISPAKLRSGVPFYVCCTSLVEDGSVHFDLNSAGARATLHTAVGGHNSFPIHTQLTDPYQILVASASIPVLVPPMVAEYFDGGISDNYSLLSANENGAEKIILLNPGKPIPRPIKSILDAAETLFSIPEWSIFQKEKEAFKNAHGASGLTEIYGAPTSCPLFDFDFKHVDRKGLFQSGYLEAKAALA